MFTLVFNGNLGSDPKLNEVNGRSVCNMRVASNRSWTSQEGERQTETAWFDVAVWGAQAEACNTYLSKGSSVTVYSDRHVKADAYLNDAGEPAASVKITASRVEFMSGGNRRDDSAESTETSGSASTDDIPF